MIDLIKRLLGSRLGCSPAPVPQSSVPVVGTLAVRRATDCYFFTSRGMQYTASKRDFQRAADLARESLQYISGFVSEIRNSHGVFDVPSIPPLEQGGRYLALVGDKEGLSQLEGVVNGNPELVAWRDKVAEHWEDLRLFNAIVEAVRSNPYCLQTDVRQLVSHPNGQRIATLILYLEKDRKIQRFREGKTYKLVCSDCVYGPPWEPSSVGESESPSATNAEVILAAGRWSTSSEMTKGRITTDDGDCWLWKGTLTGSGYGRVTRAIGGKRYNAPVHQLTWLEANGGLWPSGAIARHLCRNRACCRPDHIVPGTALENTQDAQFRDGTKDVSIHRLPPNVQASLLRDGFVEWDGQVFDLL